MDFVGIAISLVAVTVTFFVGEIVCQKTGGN